MTTSMGTQARQFVNVVTEKCSIGGSYWLGLLKASDLGSYSLRRVKASDLFYGSTQEALLKKAEQEAMAAADPCTKVLTRTCLPKPRMKFNHSRRVEGMMNFWPFYDANKILCVDTAGQAVLYDADAVTLETLPSLREPMGSDPYLPPVALSVTLPDAHDPTRPDALYVMDQKRGSFEALVYGDPSPYSIGRRFPPAFVWRWRQLPVPPFVRESAHSSIASYALLPGPDGGGTICVSSTADKVGTYCFDTASERWTKAGSWNLPFRGRGLVVPELDGLCFGVASRSPGHLCAVDLSAISINDGGDSARPPELRHDQWQFMDKPDSGWRPTNVSMVYMGAGRFCIAKTLCIRDNDTCRSVFDGAVLNGVEMVRENGGCKSNLQMIRHKSVRYGLLNHRIHVL